uniref:Obg family GTPase n=1 Tax=Thermosulfurimonas sp. TaxID=2080236 RepID=UPI0025D5A5F3
ARFATPTNQAPRYAEPGRPGEERWLILELKLIADVGLVGLPNAGKSTLLSRISAARPKIADYPFTTLQPNLGVVALSDERTFVVADLPGLIEGAHRGVGLGLDFLRHVERTRVLLQVIDASSEDPLRDFEIIEKEMAHYQPELLKKPRAVALNKIDLIPDRNLLRPVKETLERKGHPVYLISAATGEGLRDLLEGLWRLLLHGHEALNHGS